MANNVFANGHEISCKKADGKSICEFPDVCFTPPQTPPMPLGIPIPYPNTGFAKHTKKGSKKVKISGKEIMLKNKSFYKKSTGDEAGRAPKKGLITSKIKGKVYFISWSSNVKFEKKNVVRHLDMTTHNHASPPANGSVPTNNTDTSSSGEKSCEEYENDAKTACAPPGSKPKKVGKRTQRECKDDCKKAMECVLVPKGKDKEMCCRTNNTGDHLIEDHWIRPKGKLLTAFSNLAEKVNGRYKKPGGPYNGAPTMCANRSRYKGKHGIAHGIRGVLEEKFIGSDKKFTYGEGKKIALESFKHATAGSNCKTECIEKQLDDFYGSDENKELHQPTRKQPLKETQRLDAMEALSPSSSM